MGCNRAFCWSMGMLLMMMFVESTSEAVYGQLNGLTWPLVSPLIEGPGNRHPRQVHGGHWTSEVSGRE